MASASIIELTAAEVRGVLDEVRSKLGQAAFDMLSSVFQAYRNVLELLERRNITLRRLRRIVFGPQGEKTKDVCRPKPEANSGDEAVETPSEKGSGEGEKDPGSAEGSADPDPEETSPAPKPSPERPRRKGHGRTPASAYKGARNIDVPHPDLSVGDPCPRECGGRLRKLAPAVIVRFKGQPPLQAEKWLLERLRCNLCGEVFKAPTPPEVGDRKYDESAASMIAMLRYGTGMPHFRLAKLQNSLGSRLPPSTQWEVVESNVPRIYPAYAALIRRAACSRLLYTDDTTMRILEMSRRKRGPKRKGERTGVFTTGIVAEDNDGQKIALYYTGKRHAGERLQDLLQRREEDLGPPIQMSDALSRNVPKAYATLLANCLAHGRRQFVDVEPDFPDEAHHVLEQLREVYRNDERAKNEGMSAEQRLAFHQRNSGPIMGRLRKWMREQIKSKNIEPNSGFGRSITYMCKHWAKLTLFLRVAGAPLDNNVAERALKKCIIHRKNSMFFKTENGAWVGDIYMSLIHTAELAGADPFDYLKQLMVHSEEVSREPDKWMPWNYQDQLG